MCDGYSTVTTIPFFGVFQLKAAQQFVPSPPSEHPGWWQDPYWWQSCLWGRWKWSIWLPSFLFRGRLCLSHSHGQSHSPSCSPLLSCCTARTIHKTQIKRFKAVMMMIVISVLNQTKYPSYCCLRLTEAGLNCGALLLISDTCMIATPSLVSPIPPISAICSFSRKLFTT